MKLQSGHLLTFLGVAVFALLSSCSTEQFKCPDGMVPISTGTGIMTDAESCRKWGGTIVSTEYGYSKCVGAKDAPWWVTNCRPKP
jgi:hypothetical protein